MPDRDFYSALLKANSAAFQSGCYDLPDGRQSGPHQGHVAPASLTPAHGLNFGRRIVSSGLRVFWNPVQPGINHAPGGWVTGGK
jgi:hypothetical protein